MLDFSRTGEAQPTAPQTTNNMLVTKLAAVLVQVYDPVLVLEVVHKTTALPRPCLQRFIAIISLHHPVIRCLLMVVRTRTRFWRRAVGCNMLKWGEGVALSPSHHWLWS